MRIKKLTGIVVAIWFFTFVTFFAVSFRDGAAITGKIVAGRLYVGQHSHYVEVSKRWYIFSAVLTAIVGFTTPGTFCLANWDEAREKKVPYLNPFNIFIAVISLLTGSAFFFASLHCIVAACSGP